MKVLFTKILFLLIFSFASYAQDTLFLDSCQEWAKQNYPLIKQYALIEKSKNYNISNANAFYFPQISLTGKATYQSDVPSINASLFGSNSPFPSNFSYAVRKDQYQIQANIEQLIWQGVNSLKTQKDIARVNAEIQTEQNNTSLYMIRNQINQMYLGILLLDKQMEQLTISKNTLQSTLQNMSALYQNQMANTSDLDLINAEIINLDQQQIQMKSMRNTYLNMLSYFIKKPILDSGTILSIPIINIQNEDSINRRPELAWYNAQVHLFDLQKKNINISNSPRLSLYLQGGFGAPAFNFFNNNFIPYGLVGVKFLWDFTGLFTAKNDKALLDMQKNNIQVQKETFVFNNDVDRQKTMEEINKIKQLITSDQTIVKLRENVRKTSDAKVQQGTMTTLDYIKMVNDERLAHQNKALHEIQLLISLYNFKFIRNN